MYSKVGSLKLNECDLFFNLAWLGLTGNGNRAFSCHVCTVCYYLSVQEGGSCVHGFVLNPYSLAWAEAQPILV